MQGVNTNLSEAIRNIEEAQYLIDNNGVDINARDKHEDTLLHWAAKKGNIKIVECLIKKEAKIDARNIYGKTPLHLAIEQGNIEMVKLLINNGADVNSQDKYSATPLYLAATQGNIEAVELLIDNKANVDVRDRSSMTPLYLAAKQWNIEVVKLLIDNKANVDAQCRYGKTPLHVAAKQGNIEVVKLLIDNKANVDAQCKYGKTPLYWAAKQRNIEVVELLIKNGKNGVKVDAQDATILLYKAVEQGNIEMVKFLIDNKANVGVQGKYLETPLHVAAEQGNIEMVKLLIDNKANVDAQDTYLETPLHSAAEKGIIEMVDLLIKNNSKVDVPNKDGITPLHVALHNNDEGVAKLLIRYMFYFQEKPEYLTSSFRGIYSRCSEYWEHCNHQLHSFGDKQLYELLKAKSLDEQVDLWCANEALRDYCIKPEVWKDKYPDLIDVMTNIANRIRKEIFLRHNDRWKDFINKNLPFDRMKEDLEKKIRFALRLWYIDVETVEESVIETTRSPGRKQPRCSSQQAFSRFVERYLSRLINTGFVCSANTEGEIKELVEDVNNILSENYQQGEVSKEREQNSLLTDVLTPQCSEEQSCSTSR